MITLEEIAKTIEENVDRIAKLGGWPDELDKRGALLKRLPLNNSTSTGFDAGIAAALNLIPPECQKLIATIHANYNSSCVEQIREESQEMLPHTETCWWLAASSLVTHTQVDEYKFLDQISDFELLREDPLLRRDVAIEMFTTLLESFRCIGGVPFSIRGKGLQGAYLAGYRYGVQYEEEEGAFYVGTYKESLGLERFAWEERLDSEGRPTNGPVFGSRQFVKTFSFQELVKILAIIAQKLELHSPSVSPE